MNMLLIFDHLSVSRIFTSFIIFPRVTLSIATCSLSLFSFSYRSIEKDVVILQKTGDKIHRLGHFVLEGSSF